MAEYTIKDVKEIALRRRKTIVITSIVSTLLSFVIIFFTRPEPIYEAESAMKVEKVTTVAELLMGVTKLGDPVTTAVTMIRSFPVLEAVAKKAGIIPSDIKTEDVLASPQYMAVIKDLEGKIISEKDPKGGNVVIVKAQHTDPAMAKKLAVLIAESYREVAFYDSNKNLIEETKAVNDKLAEAAANLNNARDSLNAYSKKLEFTTVSDEKRLVLERYVDRRKSLDDLRFRVARINDDITTLKSGKTLDIADLRIYTPGGALANIINVLNGRMSDLQVQEESLLIHYTTLHPEVLAIREQKTSTVKQMITELEVERKYNENLVNTLENDMSTTHARLKEIPDEDKTFSILESDVASKEALYNKILQKQQEVSVRQAERTEEVTVVRYPVEPKTPITRVTLIGNAIISILLSVIIGFIGGFVHEAIDTIPRKTDILSEILGLPVLTTISDWNKPETFELVRNKYPDISDEDVMRYMSLPSHFLSDSAVAEEYRAVVPSLLLTAKENDIKALAILSAAGGEGASVFAANLAIALSQSSCTVALIDANLKSPGIHKLFGIENKPGLTDVLMGNYEWENTIRKITDLMLGDIQPGHLLSPAGLDNLYILTSGEKVENPSNFINSEKMETTIELLKKTFAFVIMDTPPALQSSEASILVKKMDAAILLTEHEKLPRGTLVKLRKLLENLRVKLAGLVVNKSKITEI